MEPFTLVYLGMIILISTFIDYMLYLHFNTLFEDQFSLTNKLIKMVENNNKKESQDLIFSDFDITGNEVIQKQEEE